MKGMSLLLVEDHASSRYCLEKALQGSGYTVHSCEDGEDALKRLTGSRFDVLVTDLNLPGINGFDVIRGARLIQPAIRTVVVTALVTREVKERVLAERVDGLFEKPIELDELLALLDLLPGSAPGRGPGYMAARH
jgi:two-component system, chemotaxis family, chemotaxis protein CheY